MASSRNDGDAMLEASELPLFGGIRPAKNTPFLSWCVCMQQRARPLKVVNGRLCLFRDRHLSFATAARAPQQQRPSTAALLPQQRTDDSTAAAFPETSFSQQNDDGGRERGPVDGHANRGDSRRQHRLHGAHEMADATPTTPPPLSSIVNNHASHTYGTTTAPRTRGYS